MAGTLFVVATPIGNLEDVSHRALRVLREAAVIAAEDTRRTAGLLHRYAIETPMVSFHAHNERDRTTELLERLAHGESVAVVSDAGAPLISDPGEDLVRMAIECGVRVEAIPGPSAVLAALTVSGQPTSPFAFLGFPPQRSFARKQWFERYRALPMTLVLFEAPHRLRATLRDAYAILGDRQISIGRELTKLHEEIVRTTLEGAARSVADPRGEYTLVIAPPATAPQFPELPTDTQVFSDFCSLTEDSPESSRRTLVETLARRYGASNQDVYRAIERGKAASGMVEPAG